MNNLQNRDAKLENKRESRREILKNLIAVSEVELEECVAGKKFKVLTHAINKQGCHRPHFNKSSPT
jgi:hypothetical protein